MIPDVVGATGGFAPGPGAFRRGIVDDDPHGLGLPGLPACIKASFVKRVFLIDIKPLKGEGKSRPAAISTTSPHPTFLAGVVTFRRGPGFFCGKLKRATKGELSCIEVGINLHMRNIKSGPHFGKAMNFAIQRQLVCDFEIGIVKQVAKNIFILEAVDSSRHGSAMPSVCFFSCLNESLTQVFCHRFPFDIAYFATILRRHLAGLNPVVDFDPHALVMSIVSFPFQ